LGGYGDDPDDISMNCKFVGVDRKGDGDVAEGREREDWFELMMGE
jgi:hypothetical protein